MSEGSNRHVDLAVVEKYFSQGLDGVLSIAGDPPARLVIAPGLSQLAMRVPAAQTTPDVTAFANLKIDLIEDEGLAWHQLSVQIEDNMNEVYAMLCNIADRVQLAGMPFSVAVDEALVSLAEILARRRGLSEDQQLGLAGELLTLFALARNLGLTTALDAWTGPMREEHDFALPAGDLEVKVTLGERRQHWISSVTQLVPSSSRQLYLVSIQLTLAGAGGGWSLQDLVSQARTLSLEHQSSLNPALERAGYRTIDADLYHARWALRSTPQFFHVDPEFPVISQAVLSATVPSSQRIVDVRYRIDLTGLTPSRELFSFEKIGSS